MLSRTMIFLNRTAEMERLDRLATREGGGLVVLYGRRRPAKFDRHEEVRVLFVPDLAGCEPDGREPGVVTAEDLLPLREE
jgi:hypothetical protein